MNSSQITVLQYHSLLWGPYYHSLLQLNAWQPSFPIPEGVPVLSKHSPSPPPCLQPASSHLSGIGRWWVGAGEVEDEVPVSLSWVLGHGYSRPCAIPLYSKHLFTKHTTMYMQTPTLIPGEPPHLGTAPQTLTPAPADHISEARPRHCALWTPA